jgi:hypothetical protein
LRQQTYPVSQTKNPLTPNPNGVPHAQAAHAAGSDVTGDAAGDVD